MNGANVIALLGAVVNQPGGQAYGSLRERACFALWWSKAGSGLLKARSALPSSRNEQFTRASSIPSEPPGTPATAQLGGMGDNGLRAVGLPLVAVEDPGLPVR